MEHSDATVVRLAAAIGKVTFGDWPAIGYDIQKILIEAAGAALKVLDESGYDGTMLDYPRFCTCGHVPWAHWPNGQCAHCDCTNPVM